MSTMEADLPGLERDHLYPARVDSVKRTVVLDDTDNIHMGTVEALAQENDSQVAKIAWLSNKAISKAYGSMEHGQPSIDALEARPVGRC